MTERLARAAARHPRRTLAAWAVTLVAAFAAIGILLPGALETEQRLTNDPPSYRADRIVSRTLPAGDQFDDVVVIRSERYTVDDPAFSAFLERWRSRGALLVSRAGKERPSRDRHAVLLPIQPAPQAADSIKRLIELVRDADRDPSFSVAMTGSWTVDHDFLELSQNDLKKGEAFFGAPAALIVLVIVFGALVAATLPLMLAIVSILVALGLVAVATHVSELSVFVINMLTAVGLALGIDYALFVLSRYREERARGLEKVDAIVAAGATASRAVLFSGTAFVIALLGMLLVPDNIMRSLAAGAILVGIVSVVAALTLVPAVLSLLGDRIDALRVPVLGRATGTAGAEGRFWTAVARAVMRRPALWLGVSVVLLLAAAAPLLDLKTGFASVSTFPASYESKRGLTALDRSFRGGLADPVRIVVPAGAPRADVKQLAHTIQVDKAFLPVRIHVANGVTILTTALRGGATDPLAVRKVRQLRDEYIPEAFAGSGAEVLVGGETSRDVDYFDTMDYWLPIVIAFVLTLSFVLLTIAFRSIVVAAKAILLNLLSVGAAYGLLVLVFEKGVGAGLLGFRQVDSVVAWVPLFLFCVLFGLSMDYHVFLLSRIRERFVRTGDNDDAVAWGVGTTARLITGAALIIVVVFAGFSTGELVMFQQMGFGVAVALLLDATIVRTVLVPAAMKLLGRRNWYLPKWLEWLPDLEVERTR
jgi:RND superfamily putative drug exporter